MLSPGTIVSGYRVDGILGEGGMGIVYRATQLSLSRTVALKILATELSQDKAFRERFRREGLLQAAIDHEHIVTVYEAGETEHGLFLAMRLIRGPTLKDMILSGELDPARTLRILAQVADALDTAHDVGLTHRDIKPQNILIGSNDHTYLADFGLTQASDEVSLTETGQFIGTIDYVAPEQIQGQGATARSDVYSLAAVLYEALTGDVPFLRQNEPAVLYAHISEPPPRVTERRPELPQEIDAVVARGMAKAPGDRYASAGGAGRGGEGGLRRPAGGGRDDRTPERAAPRRPSGRDHPGGRADRHSPGATGRLPRGGHHHARDSRARCRDSGGRRGTGSGGGHCPGCRRARGRAGSSAPAARALGRRDRAPGRPGPGRRRGRLPARQRRSDDSGTASDPLANSASAGTVGLSFPAGWRRVSEEPGIPGARFDQPVVLAPASGRARLVAGQVAATGPALLPAGLLARLPGGAPDGEPVHLGRLEALRYRNLKPRGLDGSLQLYAVPTTRGVATVACTAPAGPEAASFRGNCESVATSLQLSGAEPYALGPDPAYARTLSATLGKLDRASRPAAARLRRADTPAAQANAAHALERQHLAASRALARARVSPADAGGNATVAAALKAISLAYLRAGDAAKANDSGAYAAAGKALREEQARLKRALAGLERLGYSVS